MEDRLNINVSAVDYDKTSKQIEKTLTLAEEMVHEEDDFKITDSEFAFGWHFFVVTIDKTLVRKLAEQMGSDFEKFKGKGTDKKFLTWLSNQMEGKVPRFKLAIKEEMETSKYGIF